MRKITGKLPFYQSEHFPIPNWWCSTEAFIESILRIGFGHLSFHGTPEQSTLPAATKELEPKRALFDGCDLMVLIPNICVYIYTYIHIYIYSIIEFYVAIGSRCLKLYRCLYTDTYFADEVGLKLLDFVASLAVDLCRHDESTWASQHRPLGCRSSELSPHLWDMGLKLSVLNAFHHS